MRKCKFIKMTKGSDGQWELTEFEGIFHQWGCNYEEFEKGAGNYTVGIVETSDGKIHMPMADDITFLDK
jgi:hypothetical protein